MVPKFYFKMSYIRKKKVAGKEYAYVVSNAWHKRKKDARQKVKGYLGRVFKAEKIPGFLFTHFLVKAGKIKEETELQDYLAKNSKGKVVKDLLLFELQSHGFSSLTPWLYAKEGLHFNLDDFGLFHKEGNKVNENIVIEMNEGFLCEKTLKKLVNFKVSGRNVDNLSYEFTKACVESGLKIPEEVFIGLFGKIYK